MVDETETRRIIEPILRRAVDHYGDPIILALAKYRPGAPKLPGKVQLDAVVSAMSELSRNGDDRFLHVRHVFADGEPALDDFAPPQKPRRGTVSKR
jgi:hypothetical protein